MYYTNIVWVVRFYILLYKSIDVLIFFIDKHLKIESKISLGVCCLYLIVNRHGKKTINISSIQRAITGQRKLKIMAEGKVRKTSLVMIGCQHQVTSPDLIDTFIFSKYRYVYLR